MNANALTMDWKALSGESDESHITGPKEITEREFMEGLEILPPIGYVRYSETETFKWSEFLCGRVTRIYCRIGQRFFFMENVVSLRHEEVVKMVREADRSSAVSTDSLEVCQHG